ncbi:hypothetical protein [Paraconexibacter algicola]|uniref:Uncharacterized protein n=1 Tax=Paraconexibacter algicola TaxID=2133960 RepID=A0A2T4UC29_9ACTN|nr:hypothetical protein [Paraconexibacter algicola]PTL54785.1 hypothetical protein C7Y72_19520 [Paraconexibacter algicola]
MWFAILTPGTHECRPIAEPGVATLYCWNDIARIRIDGPAHDVASGLRMLRASLRRRGQAGHDPRCFVCGCPYPVPDPDGVLREAGPPDPEGLAMPADAADHQPPEHGPATLLLVHLADDVHDVRDEEALVVLAGTSVAMLVPLDALDHVGPLLSQTAATLEPARCEACDAVAPGGARAGGPGRAERRATARAAARADRRGHARRGRAA